MFSGSKFFKKIQSFGRNSSKFNYSNLSGCSKLNFKEKEGQFILFLIKSANQSNSIFLTFQTIFKVVKSIEPPSKVALSFYSLQELDSTQNLNNK
jgi:hypothetical protein